VGQRQRFCSSCRGVKGQVCRVDTLELWCGSGVDGHAGDGIYSASFTLPAAQQPDLGTAKKIAVKVTASNAKQGQRWHWVVFCSVAQLSGEYQDRVPEGRLFRAGCALVGVKVLRFSAT
jgi:hypothetical protein